MHRFDALGVNVYALSYDEPDALKDFGDAHGISFHLLSDPASEVIRSFGILNTLIDADDHPWFGIPYPGTYVVDGAGVITHKFFDNNLAVRAGPEIFLRAVQGEQISDASASLSLDSASSPQDVQVKVWLDGEALAPSVQRDLVATFAVPPGRHVYAKPAPAGSVGAKLVIDANELVVQRSPQEPEGEEHSLAGSAEMFLVHHDEFELRIPLTVNNSTPGRVESIDISGEVFWQSCDDEVCDIPSSQRFEISLEVAQAPAVALAGKRGAELEPNAMVHFQNMTTRRKET